MTKLIVIFISLTLWGCSPKAPSTGQEPTTLSSNARAVIKTIHGRIVIKFYPDKAPHTVNRIAELIESGFYDGLTFHRVEPGMLIQGGDPNGNGTGGSGKKLKAEFNSQPHVPGTVAMARAQSPDSADSQFYICISALPMLDGKYTVFGQVVQGMDVVSKIAVGDKMLSVVISDK